MTAIFMTGLNNCLCKNVDVVYVSVTQYGLAFENGFPQSSHREPFFVKYVLRFERTPYASRHVKSLAKVLILQKYHVNSAQNRNNYNQQDLLKKMEQG